MSALTSTMTVSQAKRILLSERLVFGDERHILAKNLILAASDLMEASRNSQIEKDCDHCNGTGDCECECGHCHDCQQCYGSGLQDTEVKEHEVNRMNASEICGLLSSITAA